MIEHSRLAQIAPATVWIFGVGVIAFNVVLFTSGAEPVIARIALATAAALCLIAAAFFARLHRRVQLLELANEDLYSRNAQATRLVRELLTIQKPGSAAATPAPAERLDLTLEIGPTPEHDRVRELRETNATSPVSYRVLTLVHSYSGPTAEPATVIPEIGVDDEETETSWLPLGTVARGAVLFSPALLVNKTYRWTLSYLVPDGLWNPLRSAGLDVFRYDMRTVTAQGFSVTFRIPPTADAVAVQERNNRGDTSRPRKGDDGWWEARWSAGDALVSARYEWEIRVDWGPDSATPTSLSNGLATQPK